MNPLFNRFTQTGFAVLALSVLGACANMTDTPPGTALAQVQAKFGAPNFSCPMPSGGKRVIWTQQPAGQYAWGAHVDSAGNIDRIERLLTNQHFRVLASGVWTPEKVLCEFGPPARRETVGLPSVQEVVWSYRYLESDAWNSLMYVYFGHDGQRVTHFHPGPDPAYDPEFSNI